ncbi:hypothetical protein [Acinetobacter sp.]|uniref:hypothetical protein n=1 Tax=Acinetobacter sp. TaxID=472 RepID=UPI00389014DC
MNEWQKLRARYPSKTQYLRRKALQPTHLEEFSNWLVDKGADVLTFKAQNEILRFYLNGVLGIWYTNGAGSLLMHDLGKQFKKENKYD